MGWGILPLALWGALTLILLMAGIEDARRREIANWKNAGIALLAPAYWWAAGFGWSSVAWQIGIALAVFGVFTATFYLGWMGGGDVKMIGALSLWLPIQEPVRALMLMMVLMSIIGGVLTLIMMIDHWRRKPAGAVETPYGVAIAMAAMIALGEPLLNQFA